MKNIKHMIWTNDPADFNEADAKAAVAERLDKPVAEVTDSEAWEEFYDDANFCYEAETANLDQPLDGRVLCIASLGLWNGRRTGYRMMPTRNLNEVLNAFQGDYNQVYYDGANVIARDAHHDGTNFYTFREVREDKNIDVLLEKLYMGTATRADINRYTRSLRKPVCEVYGWK